MWSRAQLKDKAKVSFTRNYWWIVLVSAILILISGGFGSGFFTDEMPKLEVSFSGNDFRSGFGQLFRVEFIAEVLEAIAADIPKIVANVAVISIGVHVFIFNPMEVGGKRFFFKNLNDKATIGELLFAFENHYLNVVKTLFFRDLYIFLWSLLFVIPGIVKSYEYRMVPYLLAENPNMSKDEAFALSKQMMNGQKWEVFVLDLSFIGWEILSGFTKGLLGIFYVTPYRDMTNAALYECLCYQNTNYNDDI